MRHTFEAELPIVVAEEMDAGESKRKMLELEQPAMRYVEGGVAK